VIMAAAAFAIVFNLDQTLQTRLGSYTTALQRHTEDSAYAARHLDKLKVGRGSPVRLPRYARAPEFAGIAHWLNTPGDKPLSLAGLRGKVVLVDFWTYSCINCLRTIPHLRAWYAAYHKDGFEIVGVHTPEFAFEHELSNVESAVHRLGVTWPVALDNDYATWNDYANQYWPADYLVDKRGVIRDASFGESGYTSTETAIRELLGIGGPKTHIANLTPTETMTPETYLGAERLDRSRYVGSPIVAGKPAEYALAKSLPANAISYGGGWKLAGQIATAGFGAELRLHFHAKDVYIVLGGRGRVGVTLDRKPRPPIEVNADRLYTVVSSASTRDGVLDFTFSPGVRAYSFTFG